MTLTAKVAAARIKLAKRHPSSSMTPEQVIEEALKHKVCVAWSHTWELVNPKTWDSHNFDTRTLSYLLKTKQIELFKEGWPTDKYRWKK